MSFTNWYNEPWVRMRLFIIGVYKDRSWSPYLQISISLYICPIEENRTLINKEKEGRRNKPNDLGTTQVRDKARHEPWVQRWSSSFPSLMVRRPRRPDFATIACPRDASSVLELYPTAAMLCQLRPASAWRCASRQSLPRASPTLSRCNLRLGPPSSTWCARPRETLRPSSSPTTEAHVVLGSAVAEGS
jgi:hypothetical protein